MDKYKICVYAICKTEKKFVDRWMGAVSEAQTDERHVFSGVRLISHFYTARRRIACTGAAGGIDYQQIYQTLVPPHEYRTIYPRRTDNGYYGSAYN